MARTNLYQLYKNQIIGNRSVLDVGCGSLRDLVTFEDGPFKTLYGIDRNVENGSYQTYYKARSGINLKPLGWKEFNLRYKLQDVDLESHDLGVSQHNFIVCRNVLHFFPDPKKFDLINRMAAALVPDGLLYLQLHHTSNHHIIESEHAEKLDTNVYRSKATPEQVFYLTNDKQFIQELNKRYSILDHDVQKNERGFWFAIRRV